MAYHFETFGTEHLLLLGLFGCGCVAVGLLGRAVRGRESASAVSRWFAVVICCFTVPMQVLQLLPGDFTMGSSLPLEVCDLAWMLAVVALVTGSTRTGQLLYYWWPLVLQAILTPTLDEGYPDPRWFMFWGMHFLSMWTAVYLLASGRARPDWAGYRFSVLVTVVWLPVLMCFNAVTDTNYWYVSHKPDVSSLLDYLGPWPVYVVVEVGLVAALWAGLMTWPWTRCAARRRTMAHDEPETGVPDPR